MSKVKYNKNRPYRYTLEILYKGVTFGWQEVSSSPVSIKQAISRYDKPDSWGIKQELARGSKFRTKTYKVEVIETEVAVEDLTF